MAVVKDLVPYPIYGGGTEGYIAPEAFRFKPITE